MPANLTPQYQRAEEAFRRAQTSAERLVCLEQMLQLVPKHKGTEKLQADIKSRIKDTKADIQREATAPKGSGKHYRFPRQGAAQVVIVGGPNAGKSRILKELTKAEPEVADYPFTTREPLPGITVWEDIALQLIDTPPIAEGQFETYLLNMVRTADLVVLAFDGSSDDAPVHTRQVMKQFARRHTVLSDHTGFDTDDFSIIHVKTLLVVTRASDAEWSERVELLRETEPLDFEVLAVDLNHPSDCNQLKNALVRAAAIIRIYTKSPGQSAEYTDPFTIPLGGTVEDLAGKVHRDLPGKVKSAKVWSSGSAEALTVGKDHVLHDRDLVELQT